MKKKITLLVLFLFLLLTAPFCFAQYQLNQVIVLNQGPYGGPVTIGNYNPATKVYQNFDSLPQLRFASCVIIDSGFIYIAADSMLIKYDLNTKQKIHTQIVPGIREIAVWGSQLLVTRGYTNPLPSYFQIYGKDSLNFIYELTGVSNATEGIKVLNDTAYLAINGFWGNVGSLSVIDLNGHSENREIDLGTNGLNPFNVEVERTNNTIYTVNNLDFTNSSVTKYNAATTTFSNTLMNRPGGCSASAYYATNIFFQTSGLTDIGLFNTNNLSVWDSLLVNKSIYGIGIDSVNSNVYLGNTDYTTYGKVYIATFFGAIVDSFNVGVNPSNFAFDARNVTGINEKTYTSAKLLVYPNPSKDYVQAAFIDERNSMATMTLTDMLGRELHHQQVAANSLVTLAMNDYPQGVYFLRVIAGNETITQKIVKQ